MPQGELWEVDTPREKTQHLQNAERVSIMNTGDLMTNCERAAGVRK
jgi:hypothetical protein